MKRGWKIALIVLMIFLIPMIIGGVVLGVYIMTLMSDLPSIDKLEEPFAMSTIIYDKNGNELYKIHGEENRKVVPLDKITDHVKQATIAIEDKNFWTRPFVDFNRILKAAVNNYVFRNDQLQGASTITQQLIKNILLTNERTFERKIKEAILAYQVEQRYNRTEILELYLNQIPYGSNAYGIEQAANTFFDKSAMELDLVESAILASLPNAPTYYSPFGENRYKLMGYCKSDETQILDEEATDAAEAEAALVFSNEEVNLDTLSLKIVATGDIWFSVKIDGDDNNKVQMTLKAGEEKEFEASERIDVNFGNPSPHVYLNSLEVNVPQNLYLGISQDNAKDVLRNPEQWDELQKFIDSKNEQVAPVNTGSCESMEDDNYVLGRKDLVLLRMKEDGYISQEELNEAWIRGLSIDFHQYREAITYPHFVFYVKSYLEDRYGKDIDSMGWKVYTTIDPEMQQYAEEVVAKYGDTNETRFGASNAGLISIEPETGHIRAMVGSRDYWDVENDGNVNITTRKLQPGSSFKPFVFAALFEGQYGTGTVFWDVKTGFGPLYPDNYDGNFMGPMTARRALAFSRNIPAIKAYFLAGEEEKVIDFVYKLGITSLKEFKERVNDGVAKEDEFHYGWPLALGTGEVTPMEMVSGYSVFANNGVRREPTPIVKILDNEGNIVESWEPTENRKEVIDPQVAYEITHILSDKEARPAGVWRDRLSVPGHVTAAKTGTSNKRYANDKILPNNLWTVGYTRHLATAVWVGNNTGESMSAAATGLGGAAPIFREYMELAHKDLEPLEFEQPDGIKSVAVSTLSGDLASAKTPAGYSSSEIFANWAVPFEVDDSFVKVQVDRRNGYLANELCPADAVKEAVRFNVTSERPESPSWEQPVQQWAQRNLGALADGAGALVVIDQESPLCRKFEADELPEIYIISPQAFGYVSKGKVNVKVGIDAPFGVQSVEYYVDDFYQYTAEEAPFDIGYINMQDRFEDDSSHVIRAKVIDKNYNSATASVEVKIAQDTSDPNVEIVSPANGEKIPLGSTVQISVDAYDDYSTIGSVDIKLGGRTIESLNSTPYKTSVYIDPDTYREGKYTIEVTATDVNGNSASTSSSIEITEGAGSGSSADASANGGDLQAYIASPGAGAAFDAFSNIRIGVGVNSENVDGDHEIFIMRQEAGKKVETIDSFTVSEGQSANTYYFYWNGATEGNHEIFLMIRGNDGVRYSPRKSITVQ